MSNIDIKFDWEALPDFFSHFKKQAENDKNNHQIYNNLDLDYDEDDEDEDDDMDLGRGITAIPLPFEFRLKGYILNTNFTITHHINQIILQCEGLEALKVLTPYRAKIIFGKCWEGQEKRLQKLIEKKIRMYWETVYNN